MKLKQELQEDNLERQENEPKIYDINIVTSDLARRKTAENFLKFDEIINNFKDNGKSNQNN